ncbi:MAG: DNA polymerase I, partial [Phycisphaeraceae bacterium]
DVPIEFDLSDAKIGAVDAAALHRIFRELGFNRHSRELDRLLEEGKAVATATGEQEGDATAFPTSLFDGGATARAAGSDTATSAPDLATAAGCDYRAVTTQAELDDLVQTLRQQKLVAVDTETIGLGHRTELCGLCFSWESDTGVYVPIASPEPEKHLDRETVLEALRPVLEDESVPKCGHNLKYDLLVLRHAGVRLRGIVFDSMIGAHLLEAPGQGLDDLALAELRHETIPITRLIGERKRGAQQKTMDQVPLEEITPYAAEDADLSLRLCEKMRPRLKTHGMQRLADEIEMPLIEVLADMEFTGIRVDPSVLDEQRKKLHERITELRDQIHEAAGEPFNIDSPKQLAEVLFTKLKLPVQKRTKTGPSTDIEVLERLAEHTDLTEDQRRVPQLMVEYRQLTKLVGTYLEALKGAIEPETGRIHATFHQTGAATGRLSSSNPNLQNIPIRTEIGRQIRRAFVADEGHVLVSADYSQIELRILAHLANDKALIETFQNDQDIHAAVAAEVFGVAVDEITPEQRNHAKIVNFGIVYGVTPYGLARRIDGLDVDGAKQLITDYRKRFKGIDKFLNKCIEHAETHGHVETMLGRRRQIPQINSCNPQTRGLGERLAINSVVQGSAADLIKQAMVNLHRRIEREDLPIRLLLQIHDELVVETPDAHTETASDVLREEMENAMSLKVPLRVEIGTGPNWFEAK